MPIYMQARCSLPVLSVSAALIQHCLSASNHLVSLLPYCAVLAEPAGNLLVLSDGRVGFIDFGIVGSLAPASWQAIQVSSHRAQPLQFDSRGAVAQAPHKSHRTVLAITATQALASSAAINDWNTIARSLATVGATRADVDVQVILNLRDYSHMLGSCKSQVCGKLSCTS